MTKRGVIYARISDKDERFDKVAEQVRRLRQLAPAHDAEIIAVLDHDDGITSWAEMGEARPVRNDYERLVEGVAGGLFEMVFSTSIDRLGRYPADAFAFREVCARAGVKIVTEEGVTDPRAPLDEVMASVRTSFANAEVAIRRFKQVKRFEGQVERGLPLWGQRPFGYEVDRMRPRDAEAKAIRGAYSALLKSATLYSIQRAWNEAGLRTTKGGEFTYNSVRRILLRPHNAGIGVRHGVEQADIDPQWEPIVDRQVFEDVRTLLAARTQPVAPGRKPTYLGSGLIRCGVCGSVMRSGTARLRGETVSIYRCRVKAEGRGIGERHVAIKTATVDPILRREVAAAFLLGPKDLLGEGKNVNETRQDLVRELARVRAAQQKLLALIENDDDDLMDMETVRPNLRRLKAREDAALDAMGDEARRTAQTAMAVDLRVGVFDGHIASIDVAADLSAALEARFDELPFEQRRTLVERLLDVEVLAGRRSDRVHVSHKVAVGLNAPG